MPDGGFIRLRQSVAFEHFNVAPPGLPRVRRPALSSTRHPWLTTFERSPEAAFGDLIAGHADIGALNRLDATEAANVLFARLPPDDPARLSLGWAILGWLEKRRQQTPPEDNPNRQRWIRELRDAFDIVALLQVEEPAVALRRGYAVWNAFVSDLVMAPSRDARAGYWSMLAQTQALVRKAAPMLDPFGLAAHWLWVCENAGGKLPDHYLGIGLLGLRRLPPTEQGGELPLLTGLACWADARQPPPDAFRTQWLALKALYPRTPERWRDLVAMVLSASRFQDKGIVAPAWWDIDPDLS